MSGPERIWLHVNELDAYLNEGDGDPEYHRADLTAAAVAAALQGAAAQADPWDGPVTKSNIVNAQSIAAQQIRARILAHIDPTGLAALEAVKSRVRAELADVRRWYHYPIEMPVTAGGQGPATVGVDAHKITYEVWDVLHNTHGSFDNLPDAINEAMRLNAAMKEPKP